MEEEDSVNELTPGYTQAGRFLSSSSLDRTLRQVIHQQQQTPEIQPDLKQIPQEQSTKSMKGIILHISGLYYESKAVRLTARKRCIHEEPPGTALAETWRHMRQTHSPQIVLLQS